MGEVTAYLTVYFRLKQQQRQSLGDSKIFHKMLITNLLFFLMCYVGGKKHIIFKNYL